MEPRAKGILGSPARCCDNILLVAIAATERVKDGALQRLVLAGEGRILYSVSSSPALGRPSPQGRMVADPADSCGCVCGMVSSGTAPGTRSAHVRSDSGCHRAGVGGERAWTVRNHYRSSACSPM